MTQEGGVADQCIQSLGGLTLDQLRWIYSIYTEEDLEASGWDPTSVPNSDGNDDTHLWSELSANCPAVEIRIAGPDSESGTFRYMARSIFEEFELGEVFDASRPNGYFSSAVDDDLVLYVAENADAIAFLGLHYFLENEALVSAVPIQNGNGNFVKPNSFNIAVGSYTPFSRRIYMNLYNDAEALAMTMPFVEFGLSAAGSALTEEAGYVPIPDQANMWDEIASTTVSRHSNP